MYTIVYFEPNMHTLVLVLEMACISFILIMTTFSWSCFDEDMY